MSLSLAQTFSAVALNITSSFGASGGTAPYVYTVLPNGVGGTINSSTGLYTAPSVLPFTLQDPYSPLQLFDTIQVKDASGGTAQSEIFVGTVPLLLCDILQEELGIANDHIYMWDLKIPKPTDDTLFIAVKIFRPVPFSNTTKFNGDGTTTQSVNMYADIQISAISRNHEARDRKEEIMMALNSQYSQSQQYANSFKIGNLPPGRQVINVSEQDGAAIPYRYDMMVGIQYFISKIKSVSYFDTFSTTQLTTEP